VAYATFANGGTRYAPEVGAGVVDPSGKVLTTVKPKVVDHVTYSPGAYQAMQAGFEGAVQNPHGTAYGAFAGFPLGTFPMAGKTGTASGANGTVPTSWFVGWGPEPTPRYLIAVVVEAGGFGATAAAPVVRKGFDYIVAHPFGAVSMTPPPTPTGAAPVTPAPVAPSPKGTTSTGTTSTTAPRAIRHHHRAPPGPGLGHIAATVRGPATRPPAQRPRPPTGGL
jgi:penicillin-binding protein 2